MKYASKQLQKNNTVNTLFCYTYSVVILSWHLFCVVIKCQMWLWLRNILLWFIVKGCSAWNWNAIL